jgi:hypothetical protein
MSIFTIQGQEWSCNTYIKYKSKRRVAYKTKYIVKYKVGDLWVSAWLYEGQHSFNLGYSCESEVATVCQDIADSLDKGVRTDTIIIDFSKAFDLVPHDRFLTKITVTRVVLRVVVCVKEFLLRHSQSVRVDGQLSEIIRVTSGVSQGSVLDPLLFLAYVNDIWRNSPIYGRSQTIV